MISVFNGIENIVGKTENACYQHFLLCPMFSKDSLFFFVNLFHPCFTCLQYKSFENSMGKKEIRAISPFPTVFSILLENFPVFSSNLKLSSVNPFPNKPLFLRVCSTSLLKTPWEKEKLLVTSNFSFSHSVFYPFG